MADVINKSWTLGDLVKKHPGLLPVLGDAGLPVNGCSMPAEDTLEQIALTQGWTEEQLEALVQDANKRIAENVTLKGKNGLMNVSQNAITKIKELMQKQERTDSGLRLSVSPGGCAGFSYGLMFAKESVPGDEVIELGGVKFFVDGNHLTMLQGLEIDYIDGLQGAGFKITNPNAKSSCACGSSFR
ncbi:MAG: iron-sulfur cluster assembly accessory protein [Candidatus Diapherotrites archaeon]|nr:iron-sulfur cluster assembly accessory protein [Candidatus Diapherotrites archaeon]